MAKAKKTAHVVEFRLKATTEDVRRFNVSLEVSRQIYNASLQRLFQSNKAMRSDRSIMDIESR